MKLDFSADKLISMGITVLKAVIILVAGHYLTLFLIKLMKKSLKKLNIDISLEKFLKKAVNITLHIIIILSALSTLGISTAGLLAALSAAAEKIKQVSSPNNNPETSPFSHPLPSLNDTSTAINSERIFAAMPEIFTAVALSVTNRARTANSAAENMHSNTAIAVAFSA